MTWYRPIGVRRYQSIVAMDWPEIGIRVEAGFSFNVSSPRRLWWFVHPDDPTYFLAAFWHDYAIHRLRLPRPQAAAFWDYGLRNADVPIWRRKILWLVLGLYKFS